MLNKSKLTRFLSIGLAVAGFVLVGGHLSQADAQQTGNGRDPFVQPDWKKPKTPPKPGGTTPGSKNDQNGTVADRADRRGIAGEVANPLAQLDKCNAKSIGHRSWI